MLRQLEKLQEPRRPVKLSPTQRLQRRSYAAQPVRRGPLTPRAVHSKGKHSYGLVPRCPRGPQALALRDCRISRPRAHDEAFQGVSVVSPPRWPFGSSANRGPRRRYLVLTCGSGLAVAYLADHGWRRASVVKVVEGSPSGATRAVNHLATVDPTLLVLRSTPAGSAKMLPAP